MCFRRGFERARNLLRMVVPGRASRGPDWTNTRVVVHVSDPERSVGFYVETGGKVDQALTRALLSRVEQEIAVNGGTFSVLQQSDGAGAVFLKSGKQGAEDRVERAFYLCVRKGVVSWVSLSSGVPNNVICEVDFDEFQKPLPRRVPAGPIIIIHRDLSSPEGPI